MSRELLRGDGRNVLRPSGHVVGKPVNIRRATARALWQEFLHSDGKYYSATGGTLWLIRELCENTYIDYDIAVVPNGGWLLRRH